jgi:hypothetical protein
MSDPSNDICNSTECYNYSYEDFGLRIQRYTSININYTSPGRFQYEYLVPDYFRKYYPECGFTNYKQALTSTTLPISLCLKKQLLFGPLDLYSLEEIFIRIVPSINDSPEDVSFKDDIRNKFISFALNIEKSYLYFNKGLQTCNNNLVPWEAIFNLQIARDVSFDVPIPPLDFAKNFTYIYAQNIPISQYDQYIIYNLSVNYFNTLFNSRNNKSKFNYSNILRLVLGLPIVGDLTKVNFYNLIYFSYIFLNQLFTISQTLLQGKDPGIPKQFLDLFFPPERQRYYYNLYLSWIQSRNKYLGFGDRINVSNGDGTYIRVSGISVPN